MDANQAALLKAYLWCRIIDIGFNPSGNREIPQWLSIFQRSLEKYWGLPYVQPSFERQGRRTMHGFSHDFDALSLTMSFNFKDHGGFDYVMRKKRESGYFELQHHFDAAHFMMPLNLLSTQMTLTPQHKDSIKDNADEWIPEILESMLFHPTPHQHFEPYFDHDIRFGGGTMFPFLMLMQIRYQLIPDSAAKDSEKARISDLFMEVFRNSRDTHGYRLSAGLVLGYGG